MLPAVLCSKSWRYKCWSFTRAPLSALARSFPCEAKFQKLKALLVFYKTASRTHMTSIHEVYSFSAEFLTR